MEEVTLQNSTTDVALAPKNVMPLHVADLNDGLLPELETAVEIPLDLMNDYWSPEEPGEKKRLYFDRIQERLVKDQNDPNITLPLQCVFFYEKVKGQPARSISNGSKRLVGLLESMGFQRGTALQITYLGKKKNTTNQYSSDRWSVQPLKIEI